MNFIEIYDHRINMDNVVQYGCLRRDDNWIMWFDHSVPKSIQIYIGKDDEEKDRILAKVDDFVGLYRTILPKKKETFSTYSKRSIIEEGSFKPLFTIEEYEKFVEYFREKMNPHECRYESDGGTCIVCGKTVIGL